MSSFDSVHERNERINQRRGSQSTWGRDGTTYRYGPSEYSPNAPSMMSGQPQYGPPRGNSNMVGENSVPLSSVVPGNVWPSDAQLSTAYAYGIRRDDGRITRLIPADERYNGQANPNMPSYQGEEGLIILPTPRQQSPSRRYGPEEMVPMDTVLALATNGRARQHAVDPTQLQIDRIVNSHPVTSTFTPPVFRREKVYCDKWIHEGVCAFTQMGCKYKHEMPTDKATQLSLGLNHGLPTWYRRAYGINISSPTSPTTGHVGSHALSSPPNNNMRLLEGPWRRSENVPSRDGNTGGSGSYNGNGERRAPGGHSFGPIGPPPSHAGFSSTNPYEKLKSETEEGEEDDDDDTVTFHGRSSGQQH